jgi:bifunctional DNase/RNase
MADGVDEQVDSRPSDALALALRVNAPVFVPKEMLFETTFEELKANLTRKQEN